MIKTDIESVRRAARIYASNKDAAIALGIDPRSFARICRENSIQTPYYRSRLKRRKSQEDLG